MKDVLSSGQRAEKQQSIATRMRPTNKNNSRNGGVDGHGTVGEIELGRSKLTAIFARF